MCTTGKMWLRFLSITAAVVLLISTQPLLADPHDGYKQRQEQEGYASSREYKYEEKGPGYKCEYKRDRHGYKEECKYEGGPPPWAPAHGHRRKHEKHRHVHERQKHDRDCCHDREPGRGEEVEDVDLGDLAGIDLGTCNREIVGAVIGGVAGGAIGSQVGRGDGRRVAIVTGSVLGVIFGAHIGRSMDEADHQCTAQVLEHTPDHRTVTWNDPNRGTRYAVTPVETFDREGQSCRDFVTEATVSGRTENVWGTACKSLDGKWVIAQHAAL